MICRQSLRPTGPVRRDGHQHTLFAGNLASIQALTVVGIWNCPLVGAQEESRACKRRKLVSLDLQTLRRGTHKIRARHFRRVGRRVVRLQVRGESASSKVNETPRREDLT